MGGVIKITGRHIVSNINQIVNLSSLFIRHSHSYVLCNINKKAASANSDLFIASKDFYADYLLPNMRSIDESKHVWFEHILYKSIKEFYSKKKRFVFLPTPLIQNAISGSTGKAIKKPTIKEIAVHFIKALFYCTDILHIK